VLRPSRFLLTAPNRIRVRLLDSLNDKERRSHSLIVLFRESERLGERWLPLASTCAFVVHTLMYMSNIRDRKLPMRMPVLLAVVLVLALSWLALPVSAAPQAFPKDFWERQIAKVHLGMKREDVELFLPLRSPEIDHWHNDSYTVTYALDENWSIALVYDYSGYSPVNNPQSVLHLFDDKLLKAPHLFGHKNVNSPGFPFVKPK